MRLKRWHMVTVASLLLVVYAGLLTQNHYWDGIGFALNIEESRQSSSVYFNPNHLLYNLMGYLIYTPLHQVFPGLRALTVLSAISILASVAVACLLFVMLMRWIGDLYLSVWITLLLAFSATWWKFSTDANVYVPSVFFLMLCTFLLSNPTRRPGGVTLGLLHAASMLLHQIACFFFPVVVISIWSASQWPTAREKRKAILSYSLTAGLAVAIAYATVWMAALGRGLPGADFLAWITYNGTDTFAFRSVPASVVETIRSTVRVFFGGRLTYALQFVEGPILAASGTVLVVSFAVLAAGVIRIRSKPAGDEPEFAELLIRESNRFLLAWVGVFSTFLFFWLTEYPYYRLFYLPALLMLIGIALKRRGLSAGPGARSYALPAFVVFMTAWNFLFLIYPFTKVEASPPLDLALRAKEIWKGTDVMVYYQDYTCDNWTMKYFNPHTSWRRVNFRKPDEWAGELEGALRNGRSVWIDTSALDQVASSPELQQWIGLRGTLSKRWGISSSKHRIQFARFVTK